MKKNSVFISSVYKEFINVRHEVINAVLQSGDLPICMERFNSKYGKTSEILRRYISECDYFILLIGDDYGDIEPESGLGYTEYEYTVALELGLKPMVFLKTLQTRSERMCNFIKTIQDGKECMWRSWSTVSELVTAIITSLREAEINDPRDGWVRGGVQIESSSSAQYVDFVLAEEGKSNEIIVLPKRLNTAYKPESMIMEIAEQRYGHGISKESYEKYVSGHMKRSAQFFEYIKSGRMYYELFDKSTLIEYVQGMHHNGIKSLNKKYMLEMLVKWKQTILSYPNNYFIGLVDAVLPFKYEIFDRKTVSMHETVGRHSKNRVSTLIIREKKVVDALVNDFEAMWNLLDSEECESKYICDWIDNNLISAIDRKKSVSFPQLSKSRQVRIANMFNCRDLGGLVTKDNKLTRYGVFYRADLPGTLTDEDKAELKRRDIALCIDLRHKGAVLEKPSAFRDVEGVEYLNIHYSDNLNEKISMRLNACDFDSNEWSEIFIEVIEKERLWVKNIFEAIAQNKEAVIFHCTWGRDRAALVSILLLMLAGVDECDIAADYIMSNAYCSARQLKIANGDLNGQREVKAKIALSTVEYIVITYYTIENYLFSCGISMQDIASIKSRLVEE